MTTSSFRILVIEDDASSVLLMTKWLTHLGYEVVAVAASGDEAIQRALETRPDLALVDIQLEGDRDGIETVAHLRAHLDLALIYSAYLEVRSTEMERALLDRFLAVTGFSRTLYENLAEAREWTGEGRLQTKLS